MLFTPKNISHSKVFKVKSKNKVLSPIPLVPTNYKFGLSRYMLISTECGILDSKHLISARSFLKKRFKKNAEILFLSFPHFPVASRSKGTRMGKGKGMTDHWSIGINIGTPLISLESQYLEGDIKRMLLRVGTILPIKTEVLEY